MARSYSSATSTEVSSRAESADANISLAPMSAARPILPPRESDASVIRVGRYEFAECIAKGGMATVHFARLHGDFDFSRIVAVKRLLPHFARDEQFKAMFIEEARLAARIRHPNVVPTLDVVADGDEVILVMDYVHGDSLSSLCKELRAHSDGNAPVAVTTAIMSDVLRGLAFAHATTDKLGRPLNIVHCDVSPQNILVGVDGVARLLDFGIAKATNSLTAADDGMVRGKPGYMAPEQLDGSAATPQSDIFAVGVVLWEMLTGRRLFGGGFQASLARRNEPLPTPSSINPAVNPELDAVALRALERDSSKRFRDATEMMAALELACTPARPTQIAEWVESLAAHTLMIRRQSLAKLEAQAPSPPLPPKAEAEWLASDDLLTDTISTARSLRATTPPRTVFRSKPIRWGMALAVLVTAFIIGGFISRSVDAEADAEARPTVAASPVLDAPAVNERTVNAPVDVATVAPNALPVAESTSSATGETNSGSNSSRRTDKSNATQGSKPTRASTRTSTCSPPYTIDSAGRKHYRAECFR
jgi:serine/threonine protein kinase